MRKKKAFTLIELLAVIIILGIVALIATPIVINVVENAQKKAFERSAQGYYDAARYVHNDMMLNYDEKDTMFIFEDGVQRSDNPGYMLETQGEVPKKGLVYLTKDGEILVSIANDKWCATTNGDGIIELTDDPNGCGYAPEECFTYSDFTLTSTIKNYMTKQDLGFEGMDETLLQVDSFDSENPSCKGIVIIPKEHEGRKVEGIKASTFKDNVNITGVILSNEMKIINTSAFSGASNLKQVAMNEELRYIGNSGFKGTQLKEVIIPENVAYLGTQSFVGAGLKKVTLLNPMMQGTNYATSIKLNPSPFLTTAVNGRQNAIEEVVIGPNVQTIPKNLFYNNIIKSLDIPSTLTSIGDSAFSNNKIATLYIPDTVTTIGNNAFANNQIIDLSIGLTLNNYNSASTGTQFNGNPLTNVTIREGVTSISWMSFANHEIVNLSLPSTLTSMSDFRNNKISHVTIPEGITELWGLDNNLLTSIQIPSSVTTLGGLSNNKFTNITIPNNVTTISDNALKGNLLTSIIIPNTVTSIGSNAFADNQLTNVEIPDSVTTIGNGAFASNQITNSSNISMSTSVNSLGYRAFANNPITTFTIDGTWDALLYKIWSPSYCNEYTNYTEQCDPFMGAPLTNLIIAEGITNVRDYMFANHEIVNLSLPSTLRFIGEQSFTRNKISSVNIPSGVTHIGDYAFNHNELTNITIPNTVSNVGLAAFNDNLLPDEQAFIYSKYNKTESENKRTIVSYGGAKKDNVIIPNGVQYIDASAFSQNQLISVTIPESVTGIGGYAFMSNQLTNITIPASVTTISSMAFYGNQFPNAEAITILGDNPNRFDSTWTTIGFPAK